MKLYFSLFLFLFIGVCHAQKVTRVNSNKISVEGDTIIYFDAEQKSITRQAHSDSLETGKYIISIKGTDEITEIHLTYKHPKLETLIGKTLPQINLTDMSRKPVKMDESDVTVVCFWNRHCRPCIRKLTALNILAEDYPDIRFVALTPDSSGEVKRLMKRLNLVWENITVVPDYKDEFNDVLHIYMYPSNVIIDKNRVVQGATVGGNTRQLLRTLERLSGTSKNDCWE
ncbi:TlpA family protein disulfide reductase [Bacteroides sp. AN502(2024)]|uniref:TlpA family protein disulfide reductase n=1 Tax=Bacteroides sp. AN502(2024) TaxID=3160599 RepID=UPI0035193C7F